MLVIVRQTHWDGGRGNFGLGGATVRKLSRCGYLARLGRGGVGEEGGVDKVEAKVKVGRVEARVSRIGR